MKRHTLPLPSFVGFARKEDHSGSYTQGVLRIGHHENVAWSCEHQHHFRSGAISCAIQARGQAIAAQLLPEAPQRRWTD